jgi:hypothetical protein
MFAHFRQVRQRLIVDLRHSRRVAAQVQSDHLGQLGSVAWSEPVSLDQRVKFWARLNQRFAAARARRPGLISEADEVKVRKQIAERIPRAQSEEELRLFLQAAVVHDVTIALEALDAGEDAMREAAKQLLRLANEGGQTRQSGEQNGARGMSLAP